MVRIHTPDEAGDDASRLMVNEAEGLFAVWDGKPARAYGGTADVAAYAREQRTRLLPPPPRKITRAGRTHGDARPAPRHTSSPTRPSGRAQAPRQAGTHTAPWPRFSSAMRPWTPQHQGPRTRQGDTRGTEKKRHLARIRTAKGPFSQCVAGDMSRFYRTLLLAEADAADQHGRASRRVSGPPPSATRPWASGSGAAESTDGHGRRGQERCADRPRERRAGRSASLPGC